LKQVWIPGTSDSGDSRWKQIFDWYVEKTSVGSADKLILDRQFTAGYSPKLVYTAYHSDLRVATDKLDEDIHEKLIVYNAAVGCLLWRKAKVGDSDQSVNDLLNYAQNMAEQVNREFARPLPKKSARTIHI
jgi:hypothetical protein